MLLIAVLACLAAGSQPVCRLTDYSGTAGTPKGIMRILQDRQGFIWVASTNGIYRHDGYEWRNFKSHSGDGTRLTANNVRSAYLSRQGNIWCLIDNHAILFDLRTYRFADVLAEYERSTGQQLTITKIRTLDNGTTWFITDDANVLTIDDDDARQVYYVMKGSTDSDTNISADGQGRTWIATPQATYLYVNHKLTKHDNVTGKKDTAPQKVFSPMSDGTGHQYEDAFGTTWQFHKTGGVYYIEKGSSQPHPYYGMGVNPGNAYNKIRDNKGDLWLVSNHRLMRLSFGRQPYQPFPPRQTARLRCGMKDGRGKLWLSDTDNGCVMLYNTDLSLLGYLTADGTLSASPRQFGAFVYSMLQDRNGSIWLGTRTDGLFRLRETSTGTFRMEHFTADNSALGGQKIFDMKEDAQGRLWLATDKDGPVCVDHTNADRPQFLYEGHGLKGFLPSYCSKAYAVLPTHDGHLLVGTSEGLYVADIKGRDIGNTKFKEHQREPNRKQSISCSYVINLTETADHRLFVVTQSGGINEIVSSNLMDDRLDFRHYDISAGLPSDLSCNIFEDGNGGLWIIYDDALVKLVADGDTHLYDLYFRNEKLEFTGMNPLRLEGGRWLLGTGEGAVVADLGLLEQNAQGFVPPIVLTSVSIEGHSIDYAPQQTDTIVLQPGERSVSLDFAALDYDHPQGIIYAFRMGSNQPWNNIAMGERSILMTNLDPGTYTITVRSTNSDGQWVANEHMVTVIVKPTFWQTGWAKLLIACIVIFVIAAILYTIYYIRRIKLQQRETMEFYLALLNKEERAEEVEHSEETKAETTAAVAVSEEDEAFMKRLLAYIEQNIGNSHASLKDMADATATSRSSLHRKTNRLMGTTPMDFLREARMRKACQLLRENGMAVVDVAYACGYSDPKYFSKCFKQATGKTPSQYREEN